MRFTEPGAVNFVLINRGLTGLQSFPFTLLKKKSSWVSDLDVLFYMWIT
jgi:hypothetical protein